MTYYSIYDCTGMTTDQMQEQANTQFHGLHYEACMWELEFCERLRHTDDTCDVSTEHIEE